VKNRLEHLRNLERRLEKSQERSSNIVFISCGQYTDEEKRLGRQVAGLVSELTPFDPYFADFQSSLEALTENILGRLSPMCWIHRNHAPTWRGCISRRYEAYTWLCVEEQEIAIAAFVVQVLKSSGECCGLHSRQHQTEGIRDQLI